ncbi:uncharacterized protein N0V89_003417 [Didymosphaeria variabile]|uniref:Clr5 domain-containing protein n=1 Tax=Didymosphaeria variabile TaxID=1932322 RepID=A0A9W8XPX0_9PLEO|nr:uncharacterized protein N0V89_003417 [Didymosphaeria variabile]KAJ4355401.1 hypothetical protein N0V89_003417 [Didymosphaeria variabile]
MPTPIDYNTGGVDTSHDPQWAQPSSSAYRAHDEGQRNATSDISNVQSSTINIRGDVAMEDVAELPQASDHLVSSQIKPPSSRRSKHADLDWEGHRAKLFELYIQEGRKLTETMEIMKQRYGFIAPAKAFKDKFRYWRFRRNLPGEVAQWMVQRASLREEIGKETHFEFGGQKWTLEQAYNGAKRTKKATEDLVNTPEGMKVSTPENANIGNSLDAHRDADELPGSPSVVAVGLETLPTTRSLPLSYNGKTRQDLAVTLNVARSFSQQGEETRAESAYLDVFHGLEHLLSPTAADTVRIGYEIASFYWERGRKTDADAILEAMSATHINQLGMEDRSTQQHILHVVELLNCWKRGEDALVLLQHAKQTATSERHARARKKDRVQERESASATVDERLQSLNAEVDSAPNPTILDHGLASARIHMATNKPALETLLKAIERQCLRDPAVLTVQGLRARAELLRHHISKGGRMSVADRSAFETAADLMKVFWGRALWDREEFKSHEIIEVSLELAVGVLRGELVKHAQWMFREIQKKATNFFGEDDERTIWALINIGIIYQTYRTWPEAKPWFQSAYAAADAAWGMKDGVYRSLEKALEKHHFAYLNDEGRPFKTIFGVCGVTIHPTRLHLD